MIGVSATSLSHILEYTIMPQRNSVELKQKEELDLASYQSYLYRLASQDPTSSDIFSNKGLAHASILMATLMANTEHKIDMYCTGLRPGILCGRDENDPNGFKGAYWEEFKKFFSETIRSKDFPENSIRILIQRDDWIDNAPLRLVGNALRDNSTRNKIKVKIITPESKQQIENALGKPDNDNVNYNFSIFDDKAFRLEYEADTYRALGSFNSSSWSKMLSKMFEDAFEKANDITERVRNLHPYNNN